MVKRSRSKKKRREEGINTIIGGQSAGEKKTSFGKQGTSLNEKDGGVGQSMTGAGN
jgi:hypothetical protein